MGLARAACLSLLTALPAALPAGAQDLGQPLSSLSGSGRPAYLTIDREELFTQSLYGQRVNDTFAAESEALAAETRQIEAELEAEERALTEERGQLSAEDFRARADAFDARVTALREERQQAQATFVNRYEAAQQDFYTRVGPILGQLLRDLGAVALLDRRAVILAAVDIDITSDAIARVDELLGDGAAAPLPEPGEALPDDGAASDGDDPGDFLETPTPGEVTGGDGAQ